MTGTYAEQFARMKRYLARLTDLKNGVAHLRSTDYYTDDLYAFFQSCHHLKDWIKHDPACAGWTDPEAHINGSADLQIAADLCNATKHLKLTSSRSGGKPSLASSDINLVVTDGLSDREKIEIAVSYRISTPSGEIDALDLAENCVKAWESFLVANGATP